MKATGDFKIPNFLEISKKKLTENREQETVHKDDNVGDARDGEVDDD